MPDTWIIETTDLRKSYGAFEAVRGLHLRVPGRSIYGFLGPNGAGGTRSASSRTCSSTRTTRTATATATAARRGMVTPTRTSSSPRARPASRTRAQVTTSAWLPASTVEGPPLGAALRVFSCKFGRLPAQSPVERGRRLCAAPWGERKGERVEESLCAAPGAVPKCRAPRAR